MKDLVKKVAVGLSTGALIAQAMVLPSFATIDVQVSGNGTSSTNTTNVTQTTNTTVNQNNVANVSNDVNAGSNTGSNRASGNTGGNVSVDTGAAVTNVSVSNTLNSNEAEVECGGCATDIVAKITDNGAKTDNDINLTVKNVTWGSQDNVANVDNDVDAYANSGANKAGYNTNGDVSVSTGMAKAVAVVTNEANANALMIGNGGEPGALTLMITGNGAKSVNTVKANLANTVTVDQDNLANLSNDVDTDANSGHNYAKGNTGGNVSVDTGSAYAGAKVDNMANFNWANVSDCCLMDGLIKVAGNGVNTDNDVNLTLASDMYATQDNVFGCEKYPQYGLFDFFFGGRHHDKDCNEVDAHADSGYNSVKDNTGSVLGDPSVDTGAASTVVEVENTGNSNVFSTGDAVPTPTPAPEMGGSMSSWMAWFFGWVVQNG